MAETPSTMGFDFSRISPSAMQKVPTPPAPQFLSYLLAACLQHLQQTSLPSQLTFQAIQQNSQPCFKPLCLSCSSFRWWLLLRRAPSPLNPTVPICITALVEESSASLFLSSISLSGVCHNVLLLSQSMASLLTCVFHSRGPPVQSRCPPQGALGLACLHLPHWRHDHLLALLEQSGTQPGRL
jgi:hypothetical protein